MMEPLPKTRSRIFLMLLVFCLGNLFFGCASSNQISITQASWSASDNSNFIVHCKGAKYDIHKVKFKPTFLVGEINEEKQASTKSIHFYVTRFTQSDSLTNITVYYDNIEKVTERSAFNKKKGRRVGVIILIILSAGVPIAM